MAWSLRRFIQGTVLALALVPAALFAQAVPEYDLKAAFVYNFALFTDWPADTSFEGGTLNICINPTSAMRPALSGLQDRAIKGRRVLVRALETADGVRSCHVLVVDAADRSRWPALLSAAGVAPVLTVADEHGGALDGSIIALSLEGGRIVFHVDTRAAVHARLVLSSKLLRLARSIQ